MKITYKTTKRISPRTVQVLLRRNEWSDWWTATDINWYLKHALFVVSAWHSRKLVGLGVLVGDGRISVAVDNLLVDEAYRHQGIGSALLERLVAKAECLRPYFFSTDVYEESTEKLYRRFGFKKNKGTWLLIHNPTRQRWVPEAMRERRKRRKT